MTLRSQRIWIWLCLLTAVVVTAGAACDGRATLVERQRCSAPMPAPPPHAMVHPTAHPRDDATHDSSSQAPAVVGGPPAGTVALDRAPAPF